jgi:hypothetical protein
MKGKEVRFGIAPSSSFATVPTDAGGAVVIGFSTINLRAEEVDTKMTGATRDHSGRSDLNGKHPYSPRLAAGQLPRAGCLSFGVAIP